MTQIVFKIASESSGNEYELSAEPTEHGLRFRCNCAAGEMGQFCKHRQAILDGKFPSDPESSGADIAQFKSWLAASCVGAMRRSIADAEEEVKQAKKKVTMLKHELGRRLEDGLA